MKVLYVILGSVTLVVGILGIFLPLLPTTPFLLLSAALYCRSSRRLYGWLMSNRLLGSYISNYRLKRAVTLSAKIVSLTLLWGSILYCIFFVVDMLWLRILLGTVLFGVTAHILSFRTLRRRNVLKMCKVRTQADIADLALMAGAIWREYYYSLVGTEQVEYMLSNLQSSEAIARQTGQDGYEYYFIDHGGRHVGYMAIKPDSSVNPDGSTNPNRRMFLSKLYILESERGKGHAREALMFLTHLCLRRGLRAIWLTVNRHNRTSIDIYLKSGFNIIGEEVADIGGGFVMDDLIMERNIA